MKANVAIIIAMAQLFAIDAQLIPLGPSIPITLSSNQTLTFIQEYRKVRVSLYLIVFEPYALTEVSIVSLHLLKS